MEKLPLPLLSRLLAPRRRLVTHTRGGEEIADQAEKEEVQGLIYYCLSNRGRGYFVTLDINLSLSLFTLNAMQLVLAIMTRGGVVAL
jgi:hypothetical protein